MAPDQLTPPGDPGEDPFEDRPAGSRAFSEPGPSAAGAEPGDPGGSRPRDYDLAWTLGRDDRAQPPDPGPGPRRPRRRRRFSAQAFAVLVSLAALGLGVVAVLLSSGAPVETIRYIQVRPPEIVGPAPPPGGAAPAPPPTAAPAASTEAPAAPLQPSPAPAGPGETAQPAPAPAPVPSAVPGPAQPAPPAQEPVVFAAGKVEPSVVLLQTSQGQGSGIIYDDGLILTAAHVVENAEPFDNLFGDESTGGPGLPGDLGIDPSDGLDSLEIPDALGGDVPDVIVHLASGLRTGGNVVGLNRELDVAVVQIDPALDLAVADIGSLSTVQVGQTAVAVGSPFGMENVVTVGVVSALNQVLGGEEMPPLGMIQTDAPINRGNSGGALADLEGRVIGMNVAIQSTFGGGNIGVGFATPIEVAIWIAEELRAGREVRFGFLGITGYTPPLGEPGAIVASVTPGGPAEAAGMEANDRIVSFDGQPVGSMDELTVAVRLRAPGTEVPVEVVRGDQVIRLFIPLGDRGAALELEDLPEDSIEPESEP